MKKADGAGASKSPKSPASPQQRPSVPLLPQDGQSRFWVAWVIVALVIAVFAIVLLTNCGKSQHQGRTTDRQHSSSSRPVPPKQEKRLWMGDYMKQHDTPAALRTRQEQVRQHESRRDIVQ